jgi:hypothetical protein
MNRIDFINFLIKEFNYKNYLEIGCAFDECFNLIDINNKVGVDPVRGGTIRKTSNDFFLENKDNFDIIFIDGLHHCDQVLLDIKNSINILNNEGIIIVHDCNPLNEDEQKVPYANTNLWYGDVWKAIVYNRQNKNIDISVGDFDFGCGVIKIRENSDIINICNNINELKYEEFDKNRKKWLRILKYEDLLKWIKGEYHA